MGFAAGAAGHCNHDCHGRLDPHGSCPLDSDPQAGGSHAGLVVMVLLTDQCIDHQAETPERDGAALGCFQCYGTQIPVAGLEATVGAAGTTAE